MLQRVKAWFQKPKPPIDIPPPSEEKQSLDDLVRANMLLGEQIDALRTRRLALKVEIERHIHNRDSKKGG